MPAPRDGWVTLAPSDRILAAVPPGTTVRLETRAGAYVHAGEPLTTVWPAPGNPQPVLRRLSATVLIADSRTMQTDVDFALRQLVDVGLRALSTAVNDPTTAVEATLQVGSLLRRLLVADPPTEAVAGPDGRQLLRPWQLSADEYVAHGFDQLRHAAPAQPQVAAALLRVLRMLLATWTRSGARSTPRRCAANALCCSAPSARPRTCTRPTWPGWRRSPPAPTRPTTAAAGSPRQRPAPQRPRNGHRAGP